MDGMLMPVSVAGMPIASEEPEMEDELPSDIDIEFDAETGAVVVNIGAEDDDVAYDSNLAEVIEPDVLQLISSDLMSLFDADKSSRKEWEEQYSKGMKMLGFTFEERTKPFKGACGVQHPLLTESIVQFQAQALKELMPAGGPVRTQVLGKETREKLMQADRVRDFMNYQITTVMEEYTPDFDQLLFYVGFGGSAFKKVYYDETKGRMVSALVLPDNLYIPYTGSSCDTPQSSCPVLSPPLPVRQRPSNTAQLTPTAPAQTLRWAERYARVLCSGGLARFVETNAPWRTTRTTQARCW